MILIDSSVWVFYYRADGDPKIKEIVGNYVAIKDFDDPVIVSYGKDPKKVYDDAIKRGYQEPVVVFVPTKDMVQIYCLVFLFLRFILPGGSGKRV